MMEDYPTAQPNQTSGGMPPVADALLDALPWAVLVLDAHGVIRRVNQQAARWLGPAPAALLGRPLAEAALPPAVAEALRQLLAPGAAAAPPEVFLPAHEQWITLTATRQAGGWVVYGQDITPQKQREQQYQALAENTPDVLTRWGPDLRLRYANAALAAKVGAPLAALLHQTKREMGLPEEAAAPYMAALQHVFDTGEPQELHHSLPTPQGPLAYHSRLVPELRDGEIDTVLGIGRDLTALHRSQAEALGLRDALARQVTDKYHALFHRLDQGFCVLEVLFDEAGARAVDFRYLEVNPAFARESGMPEGMQGRTVREVLPDLDAFWFDTYGQVARTGQPVRVEHEVPQMGRWFDVHAFPLGAPGSPQVAVLFTDSTARRQAAQRQQFLLRFSDALRAEPTVAAVANCALALLIEQLGLDRSYLTTYYLDENRADVDCQLGNDSVAPLPSYFVLSDYPEAFKTTHSHTVVIEDDFERRGLTEAEKRNSAKLGMRAMVGATLRKEHHPLWSLVAISARPRRWTPGEISLVEEVAERTWAALARARAEEARRASEDEFRAVANLVPDLLWRSAPDSENTWYNQRWHEYTGQTLEEAAGDGWQNVVHPDDQAESGRRYQAAIATVQPLRLEHRMRSAQGEYRWFQVRANPLRNERGAVTAWYGAATDIHARKLAELRLRRDAEADAFRVQFHEVLRPLADAAAIQEATARLLRDWLDAGWCYYHEFDETGTVATVTRDAVRPGLPSFVGVHDLSGVPDYLAYLRTNHVFNASEITASDLFAASVIEHYEALGVRAAVGVPLVKAGRLLAVLMVADTVPREWSAEAVAMLQEVAERTWATVERARTEAALRTREAQLAAAFESVPVGIAVVDLAGAFALNNAEYRRFIPGGHIPSRDAAVLAHWHGWNKQGQPLKPQEFPSARALRGESVVPGQEMRYTDDAGQQIWTSVSAVPTRDAAGRVTGCVAVVSDIDAGKRSAEALRASEEKYRRLFESIDEGFCIFELLYNDEGAAVDWQYTEANPAFERQTGYRSPVGKRISFFQPNLERAWFEQFAEVARTGETVRFVQYTAAMGIWYDVYALRVGAAGDHRVSLLFTDVTERKQREQQQEFLLKLSDILRTQLADTAALQAAALRLLAAHFGVMRTIYYEGEPDEDTFTLTASFEQDAVPMPAQLRLSDFSPTVADEYRTGRTQMITDTENEPLREAYRAIGVRAWLAVPFINNGRLVTVVGLHASTPRAWTAADVQLLEYFAERVYAAVEKGRAEEALRASEENLGLFVSTTSDAVYEMSPDMRQLYRLDGQRFIASTDQPSSDWVADYIPQDDQPQVWAAIAHAIQTRSPLALEHRVNRLDGTVGWAFTRAVPVLDAAGDIRKWFGAASDTTEQKRTEEALRQSEAKYRTLFDSIDEGFALEELVYDANGEVEDIIFREVNRAYERQSGLTNVVGKSIREVLPHLEQHWKDVYAQVARTGQPVRLINHAQDVDRWFDTYLTLLAGSSNHVAVVFNDITERKRREAHLAFLAEISQDLAELREVAEMIEALGEKIGRQFGVAWCNFVEFTEGAEAGVITSGWNAPEVASTKGVHRMRDLWTDEQIARNNAGEPTVVTDTETDPRMKAAGFAAMNIRSFITVPLARDGQFRFVLALPDTKPREWRADEIELAKELTTRIWTRLERTRAEEALRASEARYAALFAASPVPFMVLAPNAPDFTITAANDAYFAATYSTPADLLGRRMLDVFAADPAQPGRAESAAVARSVARVLATKQTDVMPRLRYDLVRPDGALAPCWWLAVNAPLLDAAGQVSAIIHQATNVTALHYAELAEQERQQQQAFLLKLSDALRPLADAADIQAVAAALLGEHLGVDRAYYVDLHYDTQEFVVARAWLRSGAPGHAHRYPLGDWPMPWLLNGQPWVCRDVDTDPTLPDAQRADYRGNGIRAAVVVPLLKQGRLAATLVVNQNAPHAWAAPQVALVEETAERTWAAVARARAETALRQSEEKYRTLFETIDEGVCVIELVKDARGQVTDWIYRDVNAAFEQHTGFGVAAGQRGSEVFPGIEQLWLDGLARVQQTGISQRLEGRNADTNRWLTTQYSRVGGASSSLLAAVFNDITERKQRELSTALLDEIGKDLALLSAPDELMQTVGKRLGEFLALSGCYFVDVDEARNEVSVHHGWASEDVPGLMQTFRLEDYLSEDFLRTMRAGAVFVLPDTAQDSRAEAKSYALLKVGSFVTVPFFRQGRYIGHIAVTTERAHAWQPQEIQLLQEVSSRVFPRIERARVEEALRKSEEKYRRIFEDIDQGFSLHELVVDESGRVTDVILQEVNAAFEHHTGLKHAQGKKVSELVPNLEPVWLEAMTRAYQLGETQQFEAYNAHTNRWLTSQYSRLGEAGSRLLSTIFTDITERKQRERHQEFLLELSDALRAQSSPDAVGTAATQLLAQYMGVDRCHIIKIAQDRQLGWVGPEHHAPDLPDLAGEYRFADFPESMRRLETAPLLIEDLWHDASLTAADKQSIEAMGMQAALTCAVRKGGRQSIWALNVGTRHPRAWSDYDRRLVQEAAERTWAAMARARAEEALAASEEQYRSLFDTMAEGFGLAGVVRDAAGRPADLRFLDLNPALEQQTGLDRRAVAGRLLSEIVPPAEVARWMGLFAGALDGGAPQSFEEFSAQLDRWYATSVYSRRGGEEVAWFYRDITERKRAELALAASEARLRALIANLPGAAVFIVDRALRYQLAEGEALRAAGHAPADFAGRTVQEMVPAGRWPAYRAAYEGALAGQPFEHEHEQGGRAFLTRGVPLLGPGGAVEAVLAVSYDFTDRRRAEEALRLSEEKFRTLADTAPALIWFNNERGENQSVNQHFLDFIGHTEAGVRDLAWHTLIHPDDAPAYLAGYQAAVLGQSRWQHRNRIRRHDGAWHWFENFANPLFDAEGRFLGHVGVSTDVTANVRAEAALRASEAQLAGFNAQLEQQVAERTQQLQESRDLLQSVLDSGLVAVAVFQTVRTAAGAVDDFTFVLVNKEQERMSDRLDLVGQRYAHVYPGIQKTEIWEQLLQVVATGQPQQAELYYPYDDLNRWYEYKFVALGDGVVATTLDVTARKQAEAERLRNLNLLEQAEAVAGLGSWDYHLLSGEFLWSDGMYQLFGLPLGQPVRPEVYLHYVVEEDRPQAERLVAGIAAGTDNFEETLRLRVGEQVKTVRVKVVVLRDETGQPVRVLGVDLDISELQRLEADNLRLRLRQQQALFEAVQAAQEEERRRMSESLHNGIGQILYATKLRLDLMRPLAAGAALAEAHRTADQLLGEAIRQTRALSHELVPLALENFGLATAWQGIGRELSSPRLYLHCTVLLDEDAVPLAPALQLALYRMGQELGQNIVKHALGATQATLELETMPGWVLLRAEDDGAGFAGAPGSSSGLGLRSIRDRVALLGGQLDLGDVPAGGAYVRIRLPLPVTTTP